MEAAIDGLTRDFSKGVIDTGRISRLLKPLSADERTEVWKKVWERYDAAEDAMMKARRLSPEAEAKLRSFLKK